MAKEVKKKTTNQIKNKSVSEDLLTSYRTALFKIKEFFDSIQDREFDVNNIDENLKLMQGILSVGEKLGKNIETLNILEKKVQSEEMINSKIRGSAKLSLLEDEQI